MRFYGDYNTQQQGKFETQHKTYLLIEEICLRQMRDNGDHSLISLTQSSMNNYATFFLDLFNCCCLFRSIYQVIG